MEENRDRINKIVELAVAGAKVNAVNLGAVTGDKVDHDAALLVQVPKSFGLETLDLERFLSKPKRKRAVVRMDEPLAFLEYVRQHKTTDTAIFAEINDDGTGGSIVAIIDYHEREEPANDPNASWCEHVVYFPLPLSPEWKLWHGNNRVTLGQMQFAEFIEDNAADVVNAASMIEMATNLDSRSKSHFRSIQNMHDGTCEMIYTDQIDNPQATDQTMVVPTDFRLVIPVFVGDSKYDIPCRLRYRVGDGRATFTYIMERPAHIVRDAIRRILELLENGQAAVASLDATETAPAVQGREAIAGLGIRPLAGKVAAINGIAINVENPDARSTVDTTNDQIVTPF